MCFDVKEALNYYGLSDSEVTLLRHNENMTFRVGTDYLLQIHVPVDGFQTQFLYEGADRAAIYHTEREFLFYLKERGIPIREPVKNSNGQWITRLSSGVTAAVSRWIEGTSLDKLERNDTCCNQVGELAARLHKCAEGFQGCPSIAYDEAHCRSIRKMLWGFEGALAPMYIATMQNACDAVETSLRKVRNEFRMLHADLSPSNILQTDTGLVAIDYSLFGVGHPMLDLALLFGNCGGLSCRQKIAEGYRNAGGTIRYDILDVCFALTILETIAIHFEKWAKEDWFKDKMERWHRQVFEPFNRGERLFADDFYLIHAA